MKIHWNHSIYAEGLYPLRSKMTPRKTVRQIRGAFTGQSVKYGEYHRQAVKRGEYGRNGRFTKAARPLWRDL